MKKMYEPQPFSPSTRLTHLINSTDTIIQVEDITVFPSAPNLATIGNDSHAEVVRYNALTATSLSGVERGITGVPKAWGTDEPIGRNFNSVDYQVLIDNVNELNEKKVAIIEGKDLSDENYTLEEKQKLEGIEIYTATALLAHNNADDAHADIRADISDHTSNEVLHKTTSDIAEIAKVATKADKSFALDYILLAANWVGETEPYRYTIANDTVTNTSNQEFLPSTGITKEELKTLQQANIVDDTQTDGSLTIKAFGNKPTINFPIKIIFRGD